MHFSLRHLRLPLILLLCLAAGVAAVAQKRTFTLVIDAGHGGHDAGAVGAFSKEKNINLNVALAFGRLVEANCPDVKVIYTRRTDVFIPLQRRADIANTNKADLFISVHTNALPNGRIAYGSETYSLGMARAGANLEVAKRENSVIMLENDYKHTYEGFDPNKAESYVIFEIMQDRHMKQSVELARAIQNNYAKAGRPNKGVHQAGFLVLRNTSMPSVLTELGFITTPAEEQYLNSKQGIEELSRSIYNGFLTYRRANDKTATAVPADLPSKVAAEPQLTTTPQPEAQTAEVAVVPVKVTPTAELHPAVPVHADSSHSRPKATAEPAPAPKPAATRPKPAKPAATDKKPEAQKPEQKKTDTKKPEAKKADTKAPEAKKPDTKKADAKKPEAKKAEAKKADAKKTEAKKPKVTYRIQVGAGKKEVAPTDPQFKGLSVKRVKEGTMFKYFYGTYTTHQAAQAGLKTAKAKIGGAYIVAYIDGKPASVAEARAKENEAKK